MNTPAHIGSSRSGNRSRPDMMQVSGNRVQVQASPGIGGLIGRASGQDYATEFVHNDSDERPWLSKDKVQRVRDI